MQQQEPLPGCHPFHAVFLVAPKLIEFLTHSFIKKLPIRDIFNLMQTNKKMEKFCKAQSLWMDLVSRDYHLLANLEEDPTSAKDKEKGDYYAFYKRIYSTPFKDGVGVRLTCSRETISSGARAVFTTTIINTTDHAIRAQNEQPLQSHRYEAASSFISAWEHEDNRLYLNIASPSYGTCKNAGKSISLLPSVCSSSFIEHYLIVLKVESGELYSTREIPPHSKTEFSVVGILSEGEVGLRVSGGIETDSFFMTFPSHHLKVSLFLFFFIF